MFGRVGDCILSPPSIAGSQDDASFIAASFLVTHGALYDAFWKSLCAADISARRAQLLDIGHSLTLSWPKGLFRAGKFSGVHDAGFRHTKVFVRSEASALVNQFHPPLPQHLKPSCEELGIQLVDATGALPPIERALVASMVLLTLHPFSDGNGRTARHVFVSWLLRHGITDPTHVSALAGCFSGRTLRLQLALKALRLGDTGQLFALYSDCYTAAKTEASQLHAALPYGSVGGGIRPLRRFVSTCRHECTDSCRDASRTPRGPASPLAHAVATGSLDQRRSKRSFSITFTHAATKSCANFCCASLSA